MPSRRCDSALTGQQPVALHMGACEHANAGATITNQLLYRLACSKCSAHTRVAWSWQSPLVLTCTAFACTLTQIALLTCSGSVHTQLVGFQNQAALHTVFCLDLLVLMSLQGIDRRERLRRLAMETIDLAKDPYYMRNHLGQVCMCLRPSTAPQLCMLCMANICRSAGAAAAATEDLGSWRCKQQSNQLHQHSREQTVCISRLHRMRVLIRSLL